MEQTQESYNNRDIIEIYRKEIINVSRNRCLTKEEKAAKIKQHENKIVTLGGLSDLNDSVR